MHAEYIHTQQYSELLPYLQTFHRARQLTIQIMHPCPADACRLQVTQTKWLTRTSLKNNISSATLKAWYSTTNWLVVFMNDFHICRSVRSFCANQIQWKCHAKKLMGTECNLYTKTCDNKNIYIIYNLQ